MATLCKEVAESDKALADATALRDKEKTAFEVVMKGVSQNQEACAAVVKILREYYEGAFFIQMGQETQGEADEQDDNGAENHNPIDQTLEIIR